MMKMMFDVILVYKVVDNLLILLVLKFHGIWPNDL
jgi:hypothetical protein